MTRNQSISLVILVLANLACLVLWWVGKDLFEYENPGWFWGLLAIPVISVLHFFTGPNSQARVNISDMRPFEGIESSLMSHGNGALFGMRIAAFTLLALALARPQSSLSFEDLTKEGIDIVIALDVSHSMMAQDFKPNRLASAKKVARQFISDRPDDRIGLVVYEGESFTQVPITSDHRVLQNGLAEIQPGWIEGGTAIGLGLATAVNRLKTSEAKSKIIILLTDGVSNAGQIKPVDAAHIAKAFGIRTYTIGVGTQGQAKTPYRLFPDGTYDYVMQEVEIDEEVLKEIAQVTDGEYFRATSESGLFEIYDQINQLERTKFNVTRYSNKTEEFFWFAFWALALLIMEFSLRNTIFRSTP